MSGESPLVLPYELPGEDRNFGGGLTVDLIPSSAWGQNARDELKRYRWRRISRGARIRAGGKCETCGYASREENHSDLLCHERWVWDESSGEQRLIRLMSLCRKCDAVTHIGYYRTQHGGDDTEPLAHLAQVRGWSVEQARDHMRDAESEWDRRSKVEWKMNLDILASTGLLRKA